MFYDRFHELCIKRGISVTKATEEIGLARSIGTKWKNTGATPNGTTLEKIAAYFSVTVAELLGEEKKPAPEGELSEERREVLNMIDGMSDKELIRLKQLIKIAKEGL